jgi:hypothetical protein
MGWGGRRQVLSPAGVVISLLTACSILPTPSLPTLGGYDGACRGVGLETTLAGRASDQRVAWLETTGGRRVEAAWPPGFTARFSPGLVILDETGAIVLRAGDAVPGGCVTSEDGPILIDPHIWERGP